MGNEWFTEWFDENYLHLYQHRDIGDAELQFDLILKEVSPEKNWKILDLACGEGRYSSLFRDKGYDISGVDLSETLIKSGRKKYPGLDLSVCDMRNIPGNYDMILSLFTSFGYFDEEKEDLKVISEIHSSLNPDGIFWLDLFNSNYIRDNLSVNKIEKIINGDNITEEKSIVGNRINKRICFNTSSGYKEYNESVRLYSRDELTGILNEQGFNIISVFGDYHGSDWGINSKRSIFYCRKV